MKFILTIGLLILASLNLFSQTLNLQHSSNDTISIRPQPMDEAIHHGILSNGMTYYVRKNQSPKKRAVFYLVVRAGSIQEEENQLGLAHFIEHMAFKGTRDFPNNQIIDFLQKSGVRYGADANAYTYFDKTVYQLTLPTDSIQVFNKGFDILLNWASLISFDQKEVDNERSVVIEEARMRGKNARERMENQTRNIEFNNSRFSNHLPIGKEEIIQNSTPDELRKFYKDWYRPDQQAIIIVGDFNPNKVENIIKEKFSVLQNPPNEKPLLKYQIPPISGTRVKILTDKEAEYTEFIMTVRLPGTVVRTDADFQQRLRTILLNKMLKDRFNDIIKGGRPPFNNAGGGYSTSYGNSDTFTIWAIANPNELENATKALLNELERIKKFGFTEEELANTIQWYLTTKISSSPSFVTLTSEAYTKRYEENFINEASCPSLNYEYNFISNNLNKIKLTEINSAIQSYITDQNRFILVRAPEKEKNHLPDEKTLLDWVNNSNTEIKAYQDLKFNKDIDILPINDLKPGKIDSITIDDYNGIQTIILKNGAKVILKSTNNSLGQILFDIYSFGGTSLATDADYPSAQLADDLINRSGIAKMSKIEFYKYLENKNIILKTYIKNYTQGIYGGASQFDFETALKLIHLFFTKPEKDSAIWQGILAEQKTYIANKNNSPLNVFLDTVNMTLYGNNPRALALDEKMLNLANINKSYDFYKNRFSDASNFTFIFVGNLDNINIRRLIKDYIGSLPSRNSKETFKDLGMYPLLGKITKVVNKGYENKSTVEMVFSGKYDYNDANNLLLYALGEVLQIKLLERLREQESGVYSPSVNISYSNYPTGQYKFEIEFTCAPANVDRLVAATLDEIEKIKKNGCTRVDIEKVKAQEKRTYQLNVKDNSFWLDNIAKAYRNNQSPNYIVDYVDNLQVITIERTKLIANKYLDGSNLIKVFLLPENK